MDIFHVFSIDAAHHLPCVDMNHKCHRLHGHTFRVEVHISGNVDESRGWVRDFADVQAAFAPLFEILDHAYLNEIEGLSNPTSENLARWIWPRLRATLPELVRVVVQETPGVGCTYCGEEQ